MIQVRDFASATCISINDTAKVVRKQGKVALGLIESFISEVQATYATNKATEHSYRSALEGLLNGLADGIKAVNEPKRIKC
jgi:hypothetical protein